MLSHFFKNNNDISNIVMLWFLIIITPLMNIIFLTSTRQLSCTVFKNNENTSQVKKDVQDIHLIDRYYKTIWNIQKEIVKQLNYEKAV